MNLDVKMSNIDARQKLLFVKNNQILVKVIKEGEFYNKYHRYSRVIILVSIFPVTIATLRD